MYKNIRLYFIILSSIISPLIQWHYLSSLCASYRLVLCVLVIMFANDIIDLSSASGIVFKLSTISSTEDEEIIFSHFVPKAPTLAEHCARGF